jgi:hypothetical protein
MKCECLNIPLNLNKCLPVLCCKLKQCSKTYAMTSANAAFCAKPSVEFVYYNIAIIYSAMYIIIFYSTA